MKKVFLFLSLVIAGAFVSCSDDNDQKVVSKSSLASITDFSINFKGVEANYEGLGTENITVSVPFGTDLTGVTNVVVSNIATVVPKTGTAVVYTDGVAQKFVVTAEDGTKKTYNVTVNVRGEVGSGTKLKTLTEENGLYGNTIVYEFTYNSSNLVSKYIETDEETKVYELVYNNKNQIIEKKNTTEKMVVFYKYDDSGKIISAEEKKEDKLIHSYTYEYNKDGFLSKLIRKKSKEKDYVQSFEYTSGNVVKHTVILDEYSSTYDDKNNPFIGIFPKAYGRILAGNHRALSVNKNNPITKTGADEKLTYEYNTDNYPVSYSYQVFGFATVKVSFQYF